METATPLTRCDTCHTVFEVPREILDSADSRVRCGECLQVFDASVNLHNAQRPDFSLVDATLTESALGEADAVRESVVAPAMPQTAAEKLAERVAPAPEQPPRQPTAPPTPPPSAAPAKVQGISTGSAVAKDESHLEATMADFDLFSDNASLPETSFEFGENTIDAIRLNFDLVEDEDDDTLSDSLFSNDVTIAADRMDITAGEPKQLDTSQQSSGTDAQESSPEAETAVDKSLSRAAHTGFVLEDNDSPNTIEFDFRDKPVHTEATSAPQPALSNAVAGSMPALTGSRATPGGATESPNSVVPGAVANPGNHVVAEIHSTSVAEDVKPDRAPGDVVAFPQSAQAGQNTVAGNRPGTPGNSAITPERRPVLGRRMWQLFLVVLTVALVAALYGYRQRDNLADNSLTRPFYSAWCSFRGCTVPARFDKSKLKVVEKNIVSHSDLPDALIITVLLENRAEFEQRYPVLFLWLSDSTRRTVASNEFDPSVYLPDNNLAAGSTLAPGQRQKIAIDVRDPGRRAVSLELSLR